MTEAERIVRTAWEQYDEEGYGEPPRLIVTPEQFKDFKAAGLPEHMMQVTHGWTYWSKF